MHRRGHVGIAMLAFAPIAYVFLTDGKPILAVLSWVGVQTVEELPDLDFHIPGLTHRGISHSLFAAVAVGSALGLVGWFLGTYAFDLLNGVISVSFGLLGWVLGLFPELIGELFNALTPTLTPEGIVSDIQQSAGDVDRSAVALFGFAIGVSGVLVHLLGDVITIAGIKPFLPFSSRRVSLSSLRSNSPTANSVLFGLGVFAVVIVVLAATSPALAPVDVATAQSGNQSQNQTEAAITFSNHTSNGSTVTIERAKLPDGGFIAIHDSTFLDGAEPADSSIIAVSKNLSPGTHTNISIGVSNAPPGNYPGLNQSRLNSSQTLAATAYRDSNNNQQMDYVRTVGENDTAYTSGGEPVADVADVTIPSSEKRQQPATVTVDDQTIQDETFVVQDARLPEGGFLVVHNESYLPPESTPLESAVGVTKYLKAGQHESVKVPLLEDSVTTDQALVAVPYTDTNNNQRYDYITSDGFQDTAYVDRTGNQSVIVNETAAVTVESTERTSGNAETSETPTTTPLDTTTAFRITNVSVSNRTAHVGDEVTIRARVENPSETRLDGEIALATAGEAVETQQVALFPRESQAVSFTHSYDASGKYVIKVANHTEQIRIVEEGAPLTPTTATGADSNSNASSSGAQAVNAQSSGSLSLSEILLLVVLVVALVGIVWVLITLQKRT